VIEAGSTLEAASEEARRLADRSGCAYISPFNDVGVVAGQATAAMELLEERPDVTSLIIPVGGGGLLAGAIAACRFLGRRVRILAPEPDQFASMAASVRAGRVVRVGRRSTFADGLATNLEPGSITLEIAASAPDVTFCALREDEIAAACLAVFNRESILTEGAGSAGVAAALHADDVGLPGGTIGTILCGGNVHHNVFWQMAAVRCSDPRLTALADTLGRAVEDEPQRRQWTLGVEADPEQGSVDADVGLPVALEAAIREYTGKTDVMLADFVDLAREDGLPLDASLVDVVRRVNSEVADRARESRDDTIERREQRVRVLSQLAVAARMAFEWRSPGYDQSNALAGFDLGCLGSPGVNYARFDQPGVAEIERQLAGATRISPDTHAVLMTSSGMAAFTLAAATVASVAPVHAALTAPYLYFEGSETLQDLLGDRLMIGSSYDADELAHEAATTGADVVFADPLANHPEQRMIDIVRLAQGLGVLDTSPWLVVDGSMLSTVTARPVAEAMPEHAIYYESCSKYLQFGLDIAMAGMVIVPRWLEARARRVRRNLGLGLDRYGAELFPRYRPADLDRRLASMERAALQVARELNERLECESFEVTFPGLDRHPDYHLARRIGRTGSCVTLAPLDAELGRDQLDPIVDAAIREARLRRVPLVKGVSFGFSTSRLSAAAAMAEGAAPFLRLAVGPLGVDAATQLAEVLRAAVEETTATWPRPARQPESSLAGS
jgi:cystathionine beta-lyase/cystathionine gamma-synthase